MDIKEIVAFIVVAFGAAGTGITIGVWLIKERFSKIIAVTDRMPPIEWFSEVAATMKRLPPPGWFERIEEKVDKLDPDRVLGHFDKVHALSNTTMECKMAVDRLDRVIQDHEDRLRELEPKVATIVAPTKRKR